MSKKTIYSRPNVSIHWLLTTVVLVVTTLLVAGRLLVETRVGNGDGTRSVIMNDRPNQRFLSHDQKSRSLFFNNGCPATTTNTCNTLFGIPGRRVYTNIIFGCSEVCASTWFVSVYRLLGWQCGPCKKQIDPTSSPTSSPRAGSQVCSTTTKRIVTNYYPYDKVVLQGFDVSQVKWDVSYASRGTKIEFTIPYGNSGELDAVNTLVAGIKDKQLDTSAGFESRLIVSNPATAVASCNSSNAMVHITVPKTANEICIGFDKCRQVICSLGATDVLDRTDVSYAPGNTEIFFGNSTRCVIQKPTLWDEFVVKNFPNSTFDTDFWYLIDNDGDGASNIVEYYGINLLNLFADDFNKQRPVNVTPTDPNKGDTDGDLLLDSYELLFGSDPTTKRNVTADTDIDGLTELQEQIFGTDLFQNDTDNDGVSDQVEIREGSNPVDDTDFFIWNRNSTRRSLQGTTDSCAPQGARIRLTVGDPSGSQSERYKIIVVGVAAHESPVFGQVDFGEYLIPPGVYTVRVAHVASKLTTPDYDYTASITSLESPTNWIVTVTDPSSLLGFHSESTFDYTIGKSATLSVKRSTTGKCTSYTKCFDCRSDTNCRWDVKSKNCKEACPLGEKSEKIPYVSPETCPCQQCEKWYQMEKDRDRKWIDELPECPCQVRVDTFLYTSLEVDNSPYSWDTDLSCNPFRPKTCEFYHPGAFGCLRANSRNKDSYSGQQCCYNSNGGVISKGAGAGTPDLVAGTLSNILNPFAPSHKELDVDSFDRCCKECEDATICERYIGSDTQVGARQDNRACV